jgi:hypothetical protein
MCKLHYSCENKENEVGKACRKNERRGDMNIYILGEIPKGRNLFLYTGLDRRLNLLIKEILLYVLY